jgi:hypothetical protein
MMPLWLWDLYGPWDLTEGEAINLPYYACVMLDWDGGARWELSPRQAGAILSALNHDREGYA